jgi:ribosomal protein L37AE/L43A
MIIYKKECPNCDGISYSSCKKGKWICPYCKEDLSDITAIRAKNNS